MTPELLSSMEKLQTKDLKSFDSGNFCCNETKASFVAIGVDH